MLVRQGVRVDKNEIYFELQFLLVLVTRWQHHHHQHHQQQQWCAQIMSRLRWLGTAQWERHRC